MAVVSRQGTNGACPRLTALPNRADPE
jgi:hypothetical protein